MAPKRRRVSPKKFGKTAKKTLGQVRRDREWVELTCSKSKINKLVFECVLSDKETIEWRLTADGLYPTPLTLELIVFEVHFLHGFGMPIHPFLHDLSHYYSISLCHLNPDSILHISIFINLSEAFLGIRPHFNLFRYFFCLKPFKGSGGPKVVCGVYRQLRDGMMSKYISVPLNSLLKEWNSRWFYNRDIESYMPCDIDHYPMATKNWLAKPSHNDMV